MGGWRAERQEKGMSVKKNRQGQRKRTKQQKKKYCNKVLVTKALHVLDVHIFWRHEG